MNVIRLFCSSARTAFAFFVKMMACELLGPRTMQCWFASRLALIAGVSAILCAATSVNGEIVKLAWNAGDEFLVQGYNLYYQVNSGTNFTAIDVGASTNVLIDPDVSGQYEFFVTAYGYDFLESEPSPSVFYTAVVQTTEVDVSWEKSARTNAAGYFIYYGLLNGVATKFNAGNTLSKKIGGFKSGRSYFFYADAYDSSGKSIDAYKHLNYTIPQAQPGSVNLKRVGDKPVVSLLSPLPSSIFTVGTNVTISASASDSDGTIAKVEFYVNSVKIGAVTTPPYKQVWTTITNGSYSIKAVATDNSGIRTSSLTAGVTFLR